MMEIQQDDINQIHPIEFPNVSVHKVKAKKSRFTPEQDQIIIDSLKNMKPPVWSEIAKKIPGKNGKQCRERYQHFLDPSLKRKSWTKEEDFLLIQAQHFLGPDWAKIATFLPGRTNNDVKNRYNVHLKNRSLDIFLTLFEDSN